MIVVNPKMTRIRFQKCLSDVMTGCSAMNRQTKEYFDSTPGGGVAIMAAPATLVVLVR